MLWIVISALAVLGALAGLGLGRNGAAKAASLAAGLLLAACSLAAGSVASVPNGTVGVVETFGSVDLKPPLQPGLHFVWPWQDVTNMPYVQQTMDVNSRTIGSVVDKDNVPLTMDATYAFSLNPAAAPLMIRTFGPNYETALMSRAASSSMRDETIKYTWREALSSKHDALARSMHDDFVAVIVANMIERHIPAEVAREAFDVPEVKLQEILPPQRILDANAEFQATTVNLQRQHVLTEIATAEAQRREQEGLGIKLMMNALPKEFSTADIVNVMTAVSLKTQADAMARAVEEGKVQVMVIPSGTPVTVPTTPQPAQAMRGPAEAPYHH